MGRLAVPERTPNSLSATLMFIGPPFAIEEWDFQRQKSPKVTTSQDDTGGPRPKFRDKASVSALPQVCAG
jgi:hypothetical protein